MTDISSLVIQVTGPTIQENIDKYSSMSVQEYTSTLYDSNGKLLDDGLDSIANSYYQSFVDPKQDYVLAVQLEQAERDDFLDIPDKEFKHGK